MKKAAIKGSFFVLIFLIYYNTNFFHFLILVLKVPKGATVFMYINL